MKRMRLNSKGEARLTAWLVAAGIAASATLACGADEDSSLPSAATDQKPPPASKVSSVVLSPGIGEIVRMVKARVDAQVIKAFINNSAVAYNPGAEEIVVLKQIGIPDDVLTALLQHGAQVRAQMLQAAQAPSNAAAPPPYGPPPQYNNNYSYPYPPYADYGAAYPGYPYGGYPCRYLEIAYRPYGPLISFNNSYPTYVNGYPVYAGYYVPGYGVLY